MIEVFYVIVMFYVIGLLNDGVVAWQFPSSDCMFCIFIDYNFSARIIILTVVWQ